MTDTETVTGEVVATYNDKSELPRYVRKGRPYLQKGTYKLVRVSEE